MNHMKQIRQKKWKELKENLAGLIFLWGHIAAIIVCILAFGFYNTIIIAIIYIILLYVVAIILVKRMEFYKEVAASLLDDVKQTIWSYSEKYNPHYENLPEVVVKLQALRKKVVDIKDRRTYKAYAAEHEKLKAELSIYISTLPIPTSFTYTKKNVDLSKLDS